MPIITLDAHTHIPYSIRESSRAKHLQMRVIQTGIEVIVPKSRPLAQSPESFLQEHAQWLRRQWIQLQSLPQAWPANWSQGQPLWIAGGKSRLNICFTSKKTTKVWYDKALGIVVDLNTAHATDRQIAGAVIRWYRQAAKAQVATFVEAYSPKLGRWPTAVNIRQQRRRWGSCGASGSIQINWLLMLAPLEVLEYVVVHELCHLIHRHHGKRFWAKVQTLLPEYAAQEAWLKKSGAFLRPPDLLFVGDKRACMNEKSSSP